MNHDNRTHTAHSNAGRHPSERTTHPTAHISDASRTRTSDQRRSIERRGEEKPSDTSAGGFSLALRTLPISLGVSALTGLLLLTVSAAIAYTAIDPTALMTPLAYGVLAVASIAGGMTAGARNRPNALLGGVVSGCTLALLVTVLGLVVGRGSAASDLSPAAPWLARLGIIVFHVLGAAFFRPRPKPATHSSAHPSHGRR